MKRACFESGASPYHLLIARFGFALLPTVIFKQPDANVVRTTDLIHSILPQLRTWLPPSVHLDVMSDRTITIRSSVRDVQLTLLITMALVVMVMFLFLRRVWPPHESRTYSDRQ